jgi:NAD(P)-dependent dehydrogenase (short-subunit alcohol dehydrogenase family)
MMDINVPGTFLPTKAAMPHLRKSSERTRGAQRASAHVVTLSPPLNMNPHWLGAHPSYTLSKYRMTLLSLGWAEEFRQERGGDGVGFACLWPETYIATAAVTNLADRDKMAARSRSPEIMADAAVDILSRPPADVNGKCVIDSAVQAEAGVNDLSRYGGGDDPIIDIFVDKP